MAFCSSMNFSKSSAIMSKGTEKTRNIASTSEPQNFKAQLQSLKTVVKKHSGFPLRTARRLRVSGAADSGSPSTELTSHFTGEEIQSVQAYWYSPRLKGSLQPRRKRQPSHPSRTTHATSAGPRATPTPAHPVPKQRLYSHCSGAHPGPS